MSRHLAHLPHSEVLGADLGPDELAQAKRVFSHMENLSFRRLDIFKDDPGRFDMIVMGASIQYFPDLPALIRRLRSLLLPKGEVHVFDSPFYKQGQIAAAKARSEKYYREAGYPELATHYNHHPRAKIEALGGIQMYNPKSAFNWLWVRVLRRVDSPFAWWMFPRVP